MVLAMHSSVVPDVSPEAWSNLTPSTSEDGDDLSTDPSFQENINQLKWVAYGIIAPVLIAVGVVGNVLNLIVLTRPNLKGVMYTYLIWLAISDLLSLLLTIPTLLRFTGWHRSDYLSTFYHAHLELALVNAFMACSVFIVVAVTVDRYFSVSRPTKFKNVHTPLRARLWIATSYIGSFLLYVPVCFFKEIHYEPYNNGNSSNLDDKAGRYVIKENFRITTSAAWTMYLWIKEFLVRLGPTIVLTFLNIMIIVAFHNVVRKRKALLHTSRYSCSGSPGQRTGGAIGDGAAATGSTGSGGNFQEERRLVMLLIGIVVMFVVTMTPAAFLTLFMSSDKEKSFNFQAFRAFANNMEFVNYAMNFYVYCLCSSEIRMTFLRLFRLVKMPPLLSKGAAAAIAAASAPLAPQPSPCLTEDQASSTMTVSKI